MFSISERELTGEAEHLFRREGSQYPLSTSLDGTQLLVAEAGWAVASGAFTNWDVHPDGTSFVFVRNPGAESGERGPGLPIVPIEIVVNWF